jgi:hypothetical protein
MKKSLCITLVGLAAGWAGSVPAGETNGNVTVTLTPGITYVNVRGDEHRFRQDWWINDGVNGGIENLTIDRPLKGDWTLHGEGRVIFDAHDYGVQLKIANPNIGFVRAGYTTYRKYYDNSGGYFNFSLIGPAVAGPTMLTVTDELGLDISHIFAEVGLTLPNWPVAVLGYERLQKDGTKSMVEWGSVNENGAGSRTRKIFPATKDLTDIVDIVKVEVDHDIQNVHLGNQFRYEKYSTDSLRLDDGAFTFGGPVVSNRTVTARETYQHDAFFNTFHLESHVHEMVYLSMGYLFMDLRGDAGWDVNTYDGLGNLLLVGGTPPAVSRDRDQQTLFVNLDQNSHVWNGNIMVGPFFKKSTSFYGGIQAEKTETDSAGAAELFEGTEAPAEASTFSSNNDKSWFQERIGVRFTGIPHTTLFAEGKFDQGNHGLLEQEIVTGLPNPTNLVETLDRYTDTDTERQEYKVGFNTAPIRQVMLSGNYRHSRRVNRHNNLIDTETLDLDTNLDGIVDTVEAEHQDGYSAFIDRQTLITDDVAVKLTVRPHTKMNVSFKYQYVTTKIDTIFETAGSSGETGDYQANIYTVGATVVPINRLYCTALFSYQDTHTTSQDNGSLAIATSNGDVYSVVAGAGYALDDKTDLRLDYSFSLANNSEGISLTGLDLGADYTRHGVSVNLSRKLRENIIASLRYGYYDLKDDAAGGFNNYSAHLVGGSCTIRF